ncbi:hypothetical protein EOL73_02425 [Candidatus Saccharibacteria bacterium]|nr:hypothetical protein [Candidatus Saccharibacteria bacterium]NCU40591.1 hypothetical protein [Candidatus Saccharibacteria bacterium]
MADLTYQDVNRAVNDALKPTQGELCKISSSLRDIANKTQYIDELMQSMRILQGNTNKHDPKSEMTMQNILSEIQDLKTRFDTVEKFCRDMSNYFQQKQQVEKEDEGYRSA